MDSLEEIGIFLKIYSLPKLNHTETENLNGLVTSKEIESVIKNLSTNQSSGPEGFTVQFFQTFIEELIPILLKYFQKKPKKKVALPNIFHEASIISIPKLYKDVTKKNYEHRCKTHLYNIRELNLTIHRKDCKT